MWSGWLVSSKSGCSSIRQCVGGGVPRDVVEVLWGPAVPDEGWSPMGHVPLRRVGTPDGDVDGMRTAKDYLGSCEPAGRRDLADPTRDPDNRCRPPHLRSSTILIWSWRSSSWTRTPVGSRGRRGSAGVLRPDRQAPPGVEDHQCRTPALRSPSGAQVAPKGGSQGV